MSTRLVGGTVISPDGTPLGSCPIVIELVLAEAFVVVGSLSLSSRLTLQTAADGSWQTPLQCNDELTPVGTLYQVTEKGASGKIYLIQVLSGLPTAPAVNQVLNLIVPEIVPVGGSYQPVASGPVGPIGPPGLTTIVVANRAALDALTPDVEDRLVWQKDRKILWQWSVELNQYVPINIPTFFSTAQRDQNYTERLQGHAYYLATNDTQEGLYFTTSDPSYRQNWNMPWGEVFYVQTTSPQTGISAEVDLAGLTTGTLTAPPNRLWLIHGFAQFGGITGATRPLMRLTDGSNTIKGQAIDHLAAAGQFISLDAWERLNTFGGGPILRKLRAATISNTIDTSSAANTPSYIHIMDIGPGGEPA